ncbi:MAG: oligopeptide transport system substrate-binding protein [Actinomycetota bacterium]|nr:oligopeptide transport system substrate-binding protein [Actinomycetota bacterium]
MRRPATVPFGGHPRTPGYVRLVALGAALTLVFAACGGNDKKSSANKDQNGTASGAKQGGVFRLGIVEPTAIDPYNSQESEGILVTKELFTGLVSIDNATSEIKPGVADKWSKNADCTAWTFNLHPGTTFSNGDPVDANAFIRGMTRAAKQAAASDVAYHMAGIAGYTDLHGTGEAGAKPKATTFSGLSAPDANTLVAKLSAPDCEFDKKTLQPVMSPVPASAGEADNKTFNDMPIGNGPFKLKEPWKHDQGITLVRNDGYFGDKAHLDEVDITILPTQDGLEAEYKGVQSGQFDYARIPPALQPQAKSIYEPKGGWVHKESFGINYLLVNVVNPPLMKAEARKAISLAIDRQAIIDGVFKGFQTKATSMIPPALKAFYQPDVCAECGAPDLVKAKKMAAESGIPPGTKVSLAFNTGGGHEAWVQAVQEQLQQGLGLKVDIQPSPFAELLTKEKAANATGLFRAAWSADYPSGENFLFPLLSKKSLPPGDNRGRYDNPAFDDLLARARTTTDDAQRISLIKQAEKVAIGDDMALIPLWYRSQNRVYDSTKWQNVVIDFFENPTLDTISLK